MGAIGQEEVVRDGAALLVRRGDVVIRVRPDDEVTVAQRELDLARRLLADGVPVVEPVPDAAGGTGLRRADGFVATAWWWVRVDRSATPADLGALAGRLRTETAARGPGGLDPFDPIAHILTVVGDCGDDADVCFVRDRAEELRGPFGRAAAEDPLGASVVHGDLHAGNVVVGEDGPRLLDLELGGWGPASYDTAPAVVAVRHYGATTEGLVAFLDASGANPTGWPGFETLVEAYELWVTAWAVSVAHRRADWAAEAARRVATLRDGAEHRWRLS
ncbi:MAG: phosphotransferase [Actinobacteria bacterium]|nr:phosphotransferase [Actinomycetota bacterium]